MNIGKANAIFMQIHSDRFTDEEEGLAILETIKMPTHNGIKKDYFIDALAYLLPLAFDVKPEQMSEVKKARENYAG